jgi:hypothetical protein
MDSRVPVATAADLDLRKVEAAGPPTAIGTWLSADLVLKGGKGVASMIWEPCLLSERWLRVMDTTGCVGGPKVRATLEGLWSPHQSNPPVKKPTGRGSQGAGHARRPVVTAPVQPPCDEYLA